MAESTGAEEIYGPLLTAVQAMHDSLPEGEDRALKDELLSTGARINMARQYHEKGGGNEESSIVELNRIREAVKSFAAQLDFELDIDSPEKQELYITSKNLEANLNKWLTANEEITFNGHNHEDWVQIPAGKSFKITSFDVHSRTIIIQTEEGYRMASKFGYGKGIKVTG